MIPRILSHHESKSVKGFDVWLRFVNHLLNYYLLTYLLISARASEKNNESHKTFHLFAQKFPVNVFFTKLGTNVPLVDVINDDKFCYNLFKGLNFTESQITIFRLDALALRV